MSDGSEQTIQTTNEHPAHSPERGWTAAGQLESGEQITEGSGGLATVVRTSIELYPEGIEVFNLRVAEAHTYLVRAEDFRGEPVWVHNSYRAADGKFTRDPAEPAVDIYTRENQYGGLRKSTIDALRERFADPVTGEIRDPNTNVLIREDELTGNHIDPVVDHWNTIGRFTSRANRNTWYNNIENLEPMSRVDASAQGGQMSAAGKRYAQSVGTGYSC